jgi:hypothetical protein
MNSFDIWNRATAGWRAAGKDVAASIGYVVNPGGFSYERVDGQQVRLLTDLSIFEASVVLLPANPSATFVSA